MSNSKITHVVFSTIHPRFNITVPVEEAFAFYESIQRFNRAGFDRLDEARKEKANGIARFEEGKSSTQPSFFEWQYKEESKRIWAATNSIEIERVIWDNNPSTWTFAKALTTWDFEHLIHRLVTVAVGAYSRSGINNPALEGQKPTQHYVQNHWTWGYNWATRAPLYREEEKVNACI